jgi:hypothetical protein
MDADLARFEIDGPVAYRHQFAAAEARIEGGGPYAVVG